MMAEHRCKTPDHSDQPENDHDQIIDQVISLENDYSDPSGFMTNVDNAAMLISNDQSQQPQHQRLMSDRPPLQSTQSSTEGNQLSKSSEDLLNLLLEMDPPNITGGSQQLDPDEQVGIETIRKQLMGCEVQSNQMIQQNTNSMSPVLNQYNSGNVSQQVGATHQQPNLAHHDVQQQQLISRTTPVIFSHQQQPQHQVSTPGLSQQQQQISQHHHRLSVDQSLLHGPYSNAHLGAVPVSSSSHSYTAQQHQNITRISQSSPMSMDNDSPSPSWQQPQLSPFSPPHQQHNDSNRPPSQQHRQHTVMKQHPTTTSPQIQQQIHHPLQQRSPSQSISPPATTEPSPVVKKNPLLNAQLVNSRLTSVTPSRFMSNQSNVLNQNPILNNKLSHSSYVTNTVGSPVNPSLNPQPRYIQQEQQPHQHQSNFSYDITQQQQNAQQHPTQQQTGYMPMYGHGELRQQQPTNSMFRECNVTTTASSCVPQGGVPQMIMGVTSPSGGGGGAGGLSQQVKQEIRKKVQKPKQQHQTTSLLKQLLSDDNK